MSDQSEEILAGQGQNASQRGSSSNARQTNNAITGNTTKSNVYPTLTETMSSLETIFEIPEEVGLDRAVELAPQEQVLRNFECREQTVSAVASSEVNTEPREAFDHQDESKWTNIDEILTTPDHPLTKYWDLNVRKHSCEIPDNPDSPLSQSLKTRFGRMEGVPWTKVMSFLLYQEERITQQKSIGDQKSVRVKFEWNNDQRIFSFIDGSENPKNTSDWEAKGTPLRNVKEVANYFLIWWEEDRVVRDISSTKQWQP